MKIKLKQRREKSIILKSFTSDWSTVINAWGADVIDEMLNFKLDPLRENRPRMNISWTLSREKNILRGIRAGWGWRRLQLKMLIQEKHQFQFFISHLTPVLVHCFRSAFCFHDDVSDDGNMFFSPLVCFEVHRRSAKRHSPLFFCLFVVPPNRSFASMRQQGRTRRD